MRQKISSKRFANWTKPTIQENELNEYHWIVKHKDKLKLGDKTDIGAFTYIQAEEGIEIGDGVQIGGCCFLYSVSTIGNKRGSIKIGANSSIGAQSTIMPGVTIGENVIIGAHSFVNSDISSNSVAWGVPARIIKKNNESTPIQNKSNAERYKVDNENSKIKNPVGKWERVP